MKDLCLRCGTCCGAYDGDPCIYLQKDENNQYFCQIYHSRLGLRKTIHGNTFRCVPVREILNDPWFKNISCSYRTVASKESN